MAGGLFRLPMRPRLTCPARLEFIFLVLDQAKGCFQESELIQ
jgi:hypothetical protein